MVGSIRKRISFVPQRNIKWEEGKEETVQNWIHRTDVEEEKWIEETTRTIGAWRDLSRSVYLRWAITINAMHVSVDHYKKLPSERALETQSFRITHGNPNRISLATWSGPVAAKNYLESSKLIAAYGFSDMYGVIEDIIFEASEVYFRHNPLILLKGRSFKDHRRKFAKKDSDPEAWAAVWTRRFEDWRRKKLYDGLPRVAMSYWTTAKLRKPSIYKLTEIADWMETIKMFGVLRNHITHGASTVTAELENACKTKNNMGFTFKEGEPLEVEVVHLMAIECFVDQYLTALNMSLLELVYGYGHWAKLEKQHQSK